MLSNLCGDAIALIIYYALNRFFPAREAQVVEAVHDVREYDNAPGSEESSVTGERGEGMFGLRAAGGEKDAARTDVPGPD
jgi:hypothetical protein